MGFGGSSYSIDVAVSALWRLILNRLQTLTFEALVEGKNGEERSCGSVLNEGFRGWGIWGRGIWRRGLGHLRRNAPKSR